MAGSLRLPPYGIVTKVTVVPDPKSQFRVNFDALEPLPSDLAHATQQRNKEVSALIDFPYQVAEDEAPKPKAKKKRKY